MTPPAATARSYLHQPIVFATQIENILLDRAGFPEDLAVRGFVNRRSGVQSSQPAPARNPCGMGTSWIYRSAYSSYWKSLKTRFGCIFGCKLRFMGRRAWLYPVKITFDEMRASGVREVLVIAGTIVTTTTSTSAT